jgi:SAM-dependent methyltransferase
MSEYERAQDRGDRSAYERYLAGMDASMRQKVALTAAHLLCEGRVADMGMGSGQGSEALAALYPRLHVIGVDIDPTVVALAGERFRRPNLEFVTGDIARPVFPPDSLDGIFDSSVLHHVTSYAGYRHENAADALEAQVAQLRPGGVLVVRDFLDPGPGAVWLDVPADDGRQGDDPRTASTAALLERFSREFRALASAPGFSLERVGAPSPPPRPGWRRYRLSHKHAAEFVLRKDYRQDWEAEVKEEYTYFTQRDFEALFARLGLRVLASLPLHNAWIVRNRFLDRFDLWDDDGRRLPFPATNFLIVGEKVAAGQGVTFHAGEEAALRAPGFLRLEHHRHRETGRVHDLAARPHPTVDVLPWFRDAGTLYVLARTSYPRPIAAAAAAAAIDGGGRVSYLAEPLHVLQDDRPLGATVEEALARAAGITPGRIRNMRPGTTYYPSPGGILEEVRSTFVEIDPTYVNQPLENASGFSSAGRVRAIEARQLLRAAQVGGLPDARLEINVHDLLASLGEAPGPWIGEELSLEGALSVDETAATAVLARPPRRRFEAADAPAGFLRLRALRFTEVDASGAACAERTLEFVEPAPFGPNTVAAAVLARGRDGRPVLGIDEDDLPAAQLFTGNSDLLVAPAWRLPHAITTIDDARAFARARLRDEYGVTVDGGRELGGAYRPSAGLTPELVAPVAFVATGHAPDAPRGLRWIAVDDLVAHRAALADGHLRVVLTRVAHALGRTA